MRRRNLGRREVCKSRGAATRFGGQGHTKRLGNRWRGEGVWEPQSGAGERTGVSGAALQKLLVRGATATRIEVLRCMRTDEAITPA